MPPLRLMSQAAKLPTTSPLLNVIVAPLARQCRPLRDGNAVQAAELRTVSAASGYRILMLGHSAHRKSAR
jgi:hypothetical protein